MKPIILKTKKRDIKDSLKETKEERKERINSNYFATTRTRVVDKSKKKYNRQKYKKDF